MSNPTNNQQPDMSTDPLARRPSDTSKSWQALQDYAAMGVGRSLRDLAEQYRIQSVYGTYTVKPPTTRLPTLAAWSVADQWQLRVIAYDEALAVAERAKHEAELADRRAAWRARHMEVDELLALEADQGRASLEPFLRRGPNGEITDFDLSDDKPLHLIKEATITKRSIGDLVTETSIKIKVYDAHAARVKLGEHHKLWGKTDDVLKHIDLNKLDADQLERIAAGEDPIHVLLNKPDSTEGAG